MTAMPARQPSRSQLELETGEEALRLVRITDAFAGLTRFAARALYAEAGIAASRLEFPTFDQVVDELMQSITDEQAIQLVAESRTLQRRRIAGAGRSVPEEQAARRRLRHLAESIIRAEQRRLDRSREAHDRRNPPEELEHDHELSPTQPETHP